MAIKKRRKVEEKETKLSEKTKFFDKTKNRDKAKKTESEPQQKAEQLKAEDAVREENAPNTDKNGIGREAMILFRRSMYSAKLIGTAEDLIPFAWRQPLKLSDKKKMSRVFKAIATEQVEREMRMPVKQDV